MCKRWTPSKGDHYVFAKVPITNHNICKPHAFLKEAIVQKLSADCLRENGFPNGCPDVLDIFKLADGRLCFTMEIFYGSMRLDYFTESLDTSNVPNFSCFIIESVVQVVAMLNILQVKLGMNHRDIKTSNILISEVPRKLIDLEKAIDRGITISTKYQITLIDFGFACVGCDIHLGNAYSPTDPCPKKGRDIFMFITFLFADYGEHIFGPLRHCFKNWIERDYGTLSGKKLWKFITRFRKKSYYWIYSIAANSQIKEFPYASSEIIMDLQNLLR